MHTFPKHPLALAVAMALASPAWADSIALNSTTLDGTRGTVLGNASRQSPMASFHQAQKEMVFATLRHMGINPDTLPPGIRTALERPQTTNPQAFLSFSLALDKADKGQFGQASQLLKQASKLDPSFNLAKGMEKLMPKVDITPGNSNQTLQNLRGEVREDARRTSESLNRNQTDTERNLDQRSQNRQGGDGTQRRLNTLAAGEGGEQTQNTGNDQNTGQRFNNLGLSDEGDSTQFDPNAGSNQANNTGSTGSTGDTNTTTTGGGDDNNTGQNTTQTAGNTETQTTNTGDTGNNTQENTNNLALAEQLGSETPIDNTLNTGNTTTNTNTNTGNENSANNDSNDANESNQRQEVVTNTRPINGIYGAYLNGQFVSGTVSLDQVLEETVPRTHTYVLTRIGHDSATLIYNVDTSLSGDDSNAYLGPVTGDVWEINANYLGQSKKRSAGAFDSTLTGSTGSGSNQSTVAVVIAVAGAPTPSASLPTSGVQSLVLSGGLTKNGSFDTFTKGAVIDWSTGKALGLKSISSGTASPLVMGNLDRDDAHLELAVQERTNPFTDLASHYRDSGTFTVQLYGETAPALGAGLITMQSRNAQGVATGTAEQGIVVASQFQSASPDIRPPATGETWQGPAIGLKYSATGPTAEPASATFIFAPDTALVTGGIDIGDHGFNVGQTDPNAFFSIHAFAGRNTPSSGAASYFSTQGNFSGKGWTDTEYSAMGYWAHDYATTNGQVSIMEGSTWVAGLPTTNMLVSGWADYTGKTLGALAETSGSEIVTDILTGNIDLRVDFERRKTQGSLTDLRRTSNNTVWLAQADFASSYAGVGPYQTTLTSNEVNSLYSNVQGQFYGPSAEETGGSWVIVKNSGARAAGVYTAKRGDVETVIPSGMADPLSGIYAAYIDGQFITGAAQLDLNQALATPSKHVFALTRTGEAKAQAMYNVSGGAQAGTLAAGVSLWTEAGPLEGESQQAGNNAYFAQATATSTSTTTPPPLMRVAAGAPTATTSLPASGRVVAELSGLIAETHGSNGYSDIQMHMNLDWSTGKSLSPLKLSRREDGDSPLILGRLQRNSSSLALDVRELNSPFDSDPARYFASDNMSMQFYGDDAAIAAGLFSINRLDANNQVLGTPEKGILIAHDLTDYTNTRRTPVTGENWQGYASGIAYGNSQLNRVGGSASFNFNPAMAEVTGGIDLGGGIAFATSNTDANAFFSVHEFGARASNEQGHPAQFSTQGDYAGAGWTDTDYSAMGYWSHDHASGPATITYLNGSTWVAGKLTSTPDMPATGWADFGGKVLGSLVSTGGTSPMLDLLTGNVSLRVDFGLRRTRGSLSDLTRDSNGSVWLSQADFETDFVNAGPYQAQLTGAGVITGSSLTGAFFGPNAEESGGSWVINKTSNEWATGVYTAKRGNIDTVSSSGLETPPEPLNGIYGAFISGSGLVSGTAQLDMVQALDNPSLHSFSLTRSGYSNAILNFDAGASGVDGNLNSTPSIWGLSSTFSGSSHKEGDNAYLAEVRKAGAPRYYVVTGTHTPTENLPVSGVISFQTSGLMAHSSTSVGTLQGRGLIDWGASKVFMPMSMLGSSESPLVLGQINRSTAVAELSAQQLDEEYVNDLSVYGVSNNLNLQLYGDTPKLAASLFSYQNKKAGNQNTGLAESGIVIAHDFTAASPAPYRPASPETWQGFAVGVLYDHENNELLSDRGTISLSLTPATGTVTGQIALTQGGFSTTSVDPNAYIHPHALGARITNPDGHPSYFSTQGDFTGSGWDNLSYTTAGYWAHDFQANTYGSPTWYTYTNLSTWVAGQLTPVINMPSQGVATYGGKVLGAVFHDPETYGSYGLPQTLVTGGFDMSADFNHRLVTGHINFADPSQEILEYTYADFLGRMNGNTYEALLNGFDTQGGALDANASTLAGQFNGPAANETGGRWSMRSNNMQAAGVYTGAMTHSESEFSPALWGGSVEGRFMANLAYVHQENQGGSQTPPDIVLGLMRADHGDGYITYRSNGGSTTDFSHHGQDLSAWNPAAGASNGGATYYQSADAYMLSYSLEPTSPTDHNIDILAFGGARTVQLPANGQSAYYVTMLRHDLDSGSDFRSDDQMAVDFATGKAFTPARIMPGDGSSPVIIGQVDRNAKSLHFEAAHRNLEGDNAHTAENMSAYFYGSNANILGGFLSIRGNVTGALDSIRMDTLGVMAGHTNGYPIYHSLRTISDGEAWTGYSANLIMHNDTGALDASHGLANFSFQPTQGTVIGALSDTQHINASYSHAAGDPNAFMATDGFGAMRLRDGSNDIAPFYYSTRSIYTDWENLPASSIYDYLDKLSYHYLGSWSHEEVDHTILPGSSWVAGLVSGANMPSTGYARYTGFASGLLKASDGISFDFVSGLFGMTADFQNRTVGGKIGNLSTETGITLASNGFSFDGSWAVGSDAYESTSFTSHGTGVTQAGVMGRFYGDTANKATETGGLWYMDLSGGNTLFGVYSGLNRNSMDRAAGVLAKVGSAGSLATGNTLASYSETWNVDASNNQIHSGFVTPSGIGKFTTDNAFNAPYILNHTYRQHTLNHTGDHFEFHSFDPAYDGVNFKTEDSYIQFTENRDFYRYVLSSTDGKFIEGYDGSRSTQTPISGISTYYFHQSSLHNGQTFKAPATGKDGLYYSNLYVNWANGQVYGYNLASGLQQPSVGLFLGRVNATDKRIEGSYLVKTSNIYQFDTTGAPRFMTDGDGFTLDLFGAGAQPTGIGGVFTTQWQSESLTQPATTGQSLVSGMLDRPSMVSNYQPAQDETWNGFALAFVSNRSTGVINILGNNDSNQVQIKFRPNTGDGHVWASITAGTNVLTNTVDANSATLNIQSDLNAPSEAMNATGAANATANSVYVNTKAFAAVQYSASGAGAVDTPEFVAAAPEAYGATEASRYDYTTWGYWGSDFDAGKTKTVAPSSLWVAGKQTSPGDMPSTGTATYTGMVAGVVSGSQNAYVQGQLAMSVDFANRSVGGNITDLNLNNNPATPWLPQANLSGAWTGGNTQYTASASGTNITTGGIVGAFNGPQASETGGRWVIQKNDGSQGTGIYVGKRDAITPPPTQ